MKQTITIYTQARKWNKLAQQDVSIVHSTVELTDCTFFNYKTLAEQSVEIEAPDLTKKELTKLFAQSQSVTA